MSDSNSRLVYSTDTGRIEEEKIKSQHPKGDGIVRIRKERLGRKGKGVCVIKGLHLDDDTRAKLAGELKKKCGCGGSVKDNNIEIQSDKLELIKQILETKGYQVKLAGG